MSGYARRLNCLIDGELDEEAEKRLLEELLNTPPLRARLAELQLTKTLVQAAYSGLDAAPGPGKRRPKSRRTRVRAK